MLDGATMIAPSQFLREALRMAKGWLFNRGLSLALLALLAAGMLTPPAAAQRRLRPGLYTGEYLCGQGPTALRLAIENSGGGRLIGVFDFGGNGDVPLGAYTVRVTRNRHGTYRLTPLRWIRRTGRLRHGGSAAATARRPTQRHDHGRALRRHRSARSSAERGLSGGPSGRPIPVHPVAHLAHGPALDLEMPQVRHRLSRRQAEDAVVDLAAEQDREAVERPLRLGEMRVERVEAAAMAGVQGVEPGVEAGEGLAVRGQDEQVVGQLLQLRDRIEPLAERVGFGLAEARARRWR